jgi:hypothetical protein
MNTHAYPGCVTPPELRDWTLRSESGPDFTVSGRLLGHSSSRRDRHSHPGPDVTPAGWKCSACRWIEIRIFRTDDDSYLVHTEGHTVVPGESIRITVSRTDSPYTVIELLTLRGRRTGGHVGSAFLPQPSALALAEAAHYDTELRDAYLDRAVA